MIAIFNNTIGAWKAGKPSKDSVRIGCGRKVDNQYRSISISVPTEGLNTDALNVTESNKIVPVYTENTGIYYGTFDNSANVCTTGTNKDVYLIALDIRGCKIADITKQDVFIFRYLIVKGVLYLILSVKDTCKSFDITLFNKDLGKNIVNTFDLNKMEMTSVEVPAKDTDANFKIRVFRPSRPTYLILVREEERDIIDTKILEGTSNKVLTYKDDEDLSTIAKQLDKEGYTAVTLFTNLEELLNNDFKSYDDAVCLLKTVFAQVNIVLGGVVPNVVIKR